jgi:hypothetical protein
LGLHCRTVQEAAHESFHSDHRKIKHEKDNEKAEKINQITITIYQKHLHARKETADNMIHDYSLATQPGTYRHGKSDKKERKRLHKDRFCYLSS